MKNNQKLAEQYYRVFSKCEGNQHIAGLFALKKILDIVDYNKPKKILEIGLGIGSISYSIINFLELKNIKSEYYGTEANTFCLEQLPINLKENYSKLNLFSDLKNINKQFKYDFIIIDGSDDSLEEIKYLISENGVIFIEGDRAPQQNKLLKIFPKNIFVHTISNYKEPDYGPFTNGFWSGGGKLIYINSTLKQRSNWLIEKIKTSFRNRIIRKIYR